MKFWDTSGIIALVIEEPNSPVLRDLAHRDGGVVVWWCTPIECVSAFSRRRRDHSWNEEAEEQASSLLGILSSAWTEILPSRQIRHVALKLLRNHPLRAADSLQLAAALAWAGNIPMGHEFVCLDRRLREAAKSESFSVLPGTIQAAAPPRPLKRRR